MKKLILSVALLVGSVSSAQYVDSKGNEWRKMDRVSLRISAADMLKFCAQDPCNGSIAGINLTGLTWASGDDVLALMREFEPGAPVSGNFFSASQFSAALGITYMFNTNYSMSEGTIGLTSSIDPATGAPIVGGAYYGHNMVSVNGGFSLGAGSAAMVSTKSVFLYKRAGVVISPPPLPPANCTINGRTVLHGASITMYQSASVAYGSTCQSEVRTCHDGVLSGSYSANSCIVLAAPAPKPTYTCIRYVTKKGVKVCKKYGYVD